MGSTNIEFTHLVTTKMVEFVYHETWKEYKWDEKEIDSAVSRSVRTHKKFG